MSNALLDHYVKNCPKQQYYVLQHVTKSKSKKRSIKK